MTTAAQKTPDARSDLVNHRDACTRLLIIHAVASRTFDSPSPPPRPPPNIVRTYHTTSTSTIADDFGFGLAVGSGSGCAPVCRSRLDHLAFDQGRPPSI